MATCFGGCNLAGLGLGIIQVVQVYKSGKQDLLGNLGSDHPGLEFLLQLLTGMDVVPKLADLVGMFEDVFPDDSERSRDSDQFGQCPGVEGLMLATLLRRGITRDVVIRVGQS